MGHSVSPELMDLLSKIIGGVPGYAQKQFCSPSTVTTYIDNFRFGRCEDATEEQYCTTIENFLRRCANAHLLLNEEDRSGAYCGAVYNFCAKTVALKASFIKKLCSMQQPTTPRDVERVFGLLNFGGQVLSAPVHKWFEAISWYRKLANALERGTVHRDELLPGVRILANGSRWTTPHTSIDDAEAHAVVEALSTFAKKRLMLLTSSAGVCVGVSACLRNAVSPS